MKIVISGSKFNSQITSDQCSLSQLTFDTALLLLICLQHVKLCFYCLKKVYVYVHCRCWTNQMPGHTSYAWLSGALLFTLRVHFPYHQTYKVARS